MKNFMQKRENNFSPDNILDAAFLIFDGILACTKKAKKQFSSIFDHIHKNENHPKQETEPEEHRQVRTHLQKMVIVAFWTNMESKIS